MKYFLSIFITLLIIPSITNAKVIISEIAWMGTTTSSTDEWLELYNDADTEVDLSGWGIDGSLSINFPTGKKISSHGLFLLERTDDNSLPNITADFIYTGALTNSGAQTLSLKDASGNTIDDLSFQTEWPAGDVATKNTMQWNGSTWVTATPTPKALNTGLSSTNTTNNEGENQTSNATTTSTNSGGQATTITRVDPRIDFIIPKIVYTNVQNDFKSVVVLEYMNPNRGIFIWNMGDGTTIKQTELLPIGHTYQYPGKYTISLAYYRSDYERTPYLTESKTFDVIEPIIEISSFDNGKAIKIKNPTDKKLDLSNWRIVGEDFEKAFPEMTIVAPKATIIIPVTIFDLGNITSGNIVAPNGQIIESFGSSKLTLKNTVSQNTISNNSDNKILSSVVENNISESLLAQADIGIEESSSKQKHTKYIIFGVFSLITIGLSILLERFMAQQE